MGSREICKEMAMICKKFRTGQNLVHSACCIVFIRAGPKIYKVRLLITCIVSCYNWTLNALKT